MQLCTDYSATRPQEVPVDMNFLRSLDSAHAGQLLAAMRRQHSVACEQARSAKAQLRVVEYGPAARVWCEGITAMTIIVLLIGVFLWVCWKVWNMISIQP